MKGCEGLTQAHLRYAHQILYTGSGPHGCRPFQKALLILGLADSSKALRKLSFMTMLAEPKVNRPCLDGELTGSCRRTLPTHTHTHDATQVTQASSRVPNPKSLSCWVNFWQPMWCVWHGLRSLFGKGALSSWALQRLKPGAPEALETWCLGRCKIG